VFLELAPAVVNNRLYQARKRLRKDLLAMAIEDLQSQRSSKDERFVDNVVGQTSSSDLVHGAGPGAGWLRPTRSIVIIGLEITMEGIEYGILNPTNRNPQGESKMYQRWCSATTTRWSKPTRCDFSSQRKGSRFALAEVVSARGCLRENPPTTSLHSLASLLTDLTRWA
ncbi:uncharacterized protein METZ01_LOCUS257687, partial [marine metagenome]